MLKNIIYSVIGLFILIIGLSSFENIQEGERGIITKFGEVVRIETPGVAVVMPFVYDIKTISVRTTKLEVESSASSKDLQDVSTTLAIQYNVKTNTDNIIKIYSELGLDFENTIISPAIQEATKSATALHSAEELITKRQDVKKEIFETLKARMDTQGIVVTNVDIINFHFSANFNKSIEAKVKAEQDALTAQNKLEQVKFEAEQKVAKAEAEAKRIKLEAESLRANGEDIIAKILAEAQLEAAKRWDGALPTQMIPGGTVPFIQLGR